MAVLGVRAAIDLVTPTGIDANEVFKMRVLRDGSISLGELLQQAAGIVGRANEAIMAKYGSLVTVTEEMFAIYRQGETSRLMTPTSSEFARRDPVFTTQVGHMLPLKDYRHALGWTEEYLRDASRAQIANDLQLIVEAWENRVDYEFVTRILTNTENPIGASGYDVGWAIGSGVNVPYIPPQWMGKVFDGTHSHYVVKDAASASYKDLLSDMQLHLRHHGFSGRLYCLVSEADIAAIKTALGDDFVRIVPAEINITGGSSSAPIFTVTGQPFEGVPGEIFGMYLGDFGVVELRFHPRIPSGYAWMTKPFGNLNASNGVAIRRHPAVPFGLIPDPQVTNSIVPRLQSIEFRATFGVGVNDRLNGVAGYIANGASSWVNPTIS